MSEGYLITQPPTNKIYKTSRLPSYASNNKLTQLDAESLGREWAVIETTSSTLDRQDR